MARLLYETIQFSPFLCDGAVDLPRQFDAAAAAGFDGVGVDVWSVERHLERGGTVEGLVSSLERSGTRCVELQAMTFGSPADSVMAPERFLDLVGHLRPEVVMAGSADGWDIDPAAAEQARRSVDAVEALGARAAIEFLPTLPINSIARTRELVRRVGGQVGVCIDTWHFFRGPDSWADLEDLPAAELAYVQVNDAPPLASEDLWHEMLHRRALPGEGEFDLSRFRGVIDSKGYDGPVAVEIMSEPLRALGPEEFARRALAAARTVWG